MLKAFWSFSSNWYALPEKNVAKLLLRKGQECCRKDLLFKMCLYEAITEKNFVTVTIWILLYWKKCVPKESIPNHFKQTWVQHLYVLNKVQNFASLRPYNHRIYIDEVSYPLCMTLQYEEVEKGSTTKKPSKVWYHLLLTSADIFVKIVLRKGHVWWPWNRKN